MFDWLDLTDSSTSLLRTQIWRRREKEMAAVPELYSPPSHAEFMARYVMTNSPVLIRGAQQGWGHAPDSGNEDEGGDVEVEVDAFSTEALLSRFGADVVHVSVSQTGR